MKKQINEPDFIGGQCSLTKEEEIALSQHFAKKKKKSKSSTLIIVKSKTKEQVQA